MEKFTITNADNTRMNVELVRYFKFKNDCYLIYTLNEIDEKGYLKLYLVKIMEELGFPVMYNIKDDKEWSGMQAIVKKVLKEIKNNKRKFLEDLDYNSIQGIKIVDPRYFKLDQKLAEVLSSNYNVSVNNDSGKFDSDMESNNLESNVPSDEMNMIDNSVIEPVTVVENIAPVIEESSNNLESIDETLLKQGAFAPIEPFSSVDLNNEKEIDYDIVEKGNTIESSIVENKQVTDSMLENISNKNITENQINKDDSVDNVKLEKEDKNENVELIDYKALYMAEREEKEAINATMNTLVEQLIKYKEKYGELE